ncbi:lariat debranching enzyme, C-terminal domain-containing protein [Dactylonectria estremocensis]|uniref:Lariat debranching enzyme, C-terminal domain-containing protein n=1 Tax=Dactylonectria estremocensis TaxID=1079267 RepID=A0A9P9J2Z2_9HYPO|nr:lariat debranching enzyme, C-terminal domain-containing protein [Dactylonectria estremocensis]
MATSTPSGSDSPRQPKIAVVGCGHGALDLVYSTLETECWRKGWTLSDLDLLIICGDFESFRNTADLNCMAAPRKYRKLMDFYKYYSGEATAPVLTLVIGGNHEASNYLFELYHGGWLAHNIYYLGAAGVIRYGPWRIAGLSGIYNASNYHKPHHERLPYENSHIRSIYHVREYNVQRLLQIRSQIDVGLSHDWPTWVELFGDHTSLFAEKPHFLDSAKIDNLGSKPATEVMDHLRPSYWFSGHMHVRFSATVEYKAGMSLRDSVKALPVSDALKSSLPIFESQNNPSSAKAVPNPAGTQSKTEFLGLSKAGTQARLFMELRELELPVRADPDVAQLSTLNDKGKFSLYYDEEWLAIMRAYAATLRVADSETLVVPPAKTKTKKNPSTSLPQHRTWVKENITDKGLLKVPDNFTAHAPFHDPDAPDSFDQPPEYPNQQTARFTELLQIPNKF